jgi:AP-3 complex subunit mu
MIQSLFILSSLGEVLIERHFRGVVTSRSVCDYFWERAAESVNHHGGLPSTTSLLKNQHHYNTVPPVMEAPESEQGTLYLFSVVRDNLYYLAVGPAETQPLLILTFLHRMADIFVEYFGDPADESAIKNNFSTVYQLLEEMVDYGWPLTTEPNALKAMIRPPTVMSRLLNATSNVNDELPVGTVSNMPWRTAGLVYSQNEIYMDIIEEVDAVVSHGKLIASDVSGSIQCQSHLSGIPDLLLTFKDPSLIDDCSFHPCVRYARFEKDSIVSFVPPDGDFELMRYRIRPEQAQNFQLPIFCNVQWSYLEQPGSTAVGSTKTGRIVLDAGVTAVSSLIFSASRKGPVQVEDFAITIPFPRQTRTTTDFRVSVGSIIYDEQAKTAFWKLGTMDAAKRATLSCTFTVAVTKNVEDGLLTPLNVSINWKVPLASVSGLSVSGLSITGETYRPYKGVRNICQSGLFQVRL